METTATVEQEIFMNDKIGKVCVVRERTKLTDSGSYVGVIVSNDKDEDTVCVMNWYGIHKTKPHCVITDPIYIGNYYNELKDELRRMNKLIKNYEKSMLATEETLFKKCIHWDSYVKSSVFTDRCKNLTKEKIDNLSNLTEVVAIKKERYTNYESYKWYLESLMDDIRRSVRY